jgi:hypothetical protein
MSIRQYALLIGIEYVGGTFVGSNDSISGPIRTIGPA